VAAADRAQEGSLNVSGFWPVFGVGAFGVALLEVLRWWKLREASVLPAYGMSPTYWAITIAMVCAGGLLATNGMVRPPPLLVRD
jgi:hypothetical protein